ncbi:MAG: nucleotidyltransferase domain-containing protein [Edaphocola sp.]
MLTIEQIQSTVADYFKDKPVKRVYLFGSYAKGQQKPESDIDILVDIDDSKKRLSYWDLARFLVELEDLLHAKVDLVLEKTLYPRIKENVLKSRIKLFSK